MNVSRAVDESNEALLSGVRQRVGWGVGVAIVSALVVGGVAVFGMELVSSDAQALALDHAHDLTEVARLRGAIDTVVVSERAWILTGDDSFRGEADRARAEVSTRLDALQGAISGTSGQVLLRALEDAVDAHLAVVDRLVDESRTSDPDRRATQARFLRELVAAHVGTNRALRAFERHEREQIDRARERAARDATWVFRLLVVVAAGTLTLVAVGGVISVRSTSRMAHLLALELTQRRRAEEELRGAVAARDRLVSTVSHELRNPLNVLGLSLDRLRRAAVAGEVLPLDRLERLQGNVTRMTRLVEAILLASRADPGTVHVSLEDVDVAALVRDVVDREREAAVHAGCSVEVRAPDRLIGRWDPLRLDQVVVNLLTNAIKYGGGSPIVVAVTEEADHARVMVSDKGPGIAEADQQRIFEFFERAGANSQVAGFGLGLWITRRIVGALGGKIHVESTPGHGATFAVDLPRAPVSAPTATSQVGP